ncbi:MAG: hypothetical protein IJE84_05470 [Clostridia bacterium]|nr:hypothetical protein [Clostridia bacterium]
MRKLRYAICTAVMMLLFCLCAVCASADEGKIGSSKLSAAFDVIAREHKIVKSGLVDSNVRFTEADFKQGLGVRSIDYVTFGDLPDSTDGYLTVGSMKVSEGQRVYSELLSMLEFVPASSEIGMVSFSVCGDTGTSGAEIEFTVRLIDRVNYAPTISVLGEGVNTLRALCAKSTSGMLYATDREGDRIRYEIVSYPAHGVLTSFDSEEGKFVYVSHPSYTGKDEFEYVAVDEYGNYTSIASVSVEVVSDRRGIEFSDMDCCADVSAASFAVENEIMTASVRGGAYVFCPELKIKRAEFVMMAMKAAGKEPAQKLAALDNISDVSGQSDEIKGYLAQALEQGYIKAEDRDGKLCLRPDDIITKAEAALILSRLCGYERKSDDISVFADFGRVDASYLGAISAMYSSGVIECSSGLIRPNEEITRQSCARMLYRFSQIT